MSRAHRFEMVPQSAFECKWAGGIIVIIMWEYGMTKNANEKIKNWEEFCIWLLYVNLRDNTGGGGFLWHCLMVMHCLLVHTLFDLMQMMTVVGACCAIPSHYTQQMTMYDFATIFTATVRSAVSFFSRVFHCFRNQNHIHRRRHCYIYCIPSKCFCSHKRQCDAKMHALRAPATYIIPRL